MSPAIILLEALPGPGGRAAECGGGSIDVLLRKGRPAYHGLYWWIPDMLTRGDHAEFATARAPQPLMLWAPQGDIGMPKTGVDRFREMVRPACARHRAERQLVIHQPEGEHEFTLPAFEAMAQFFATSLAIGDGR